MAGGFVISEGSAVALGSFDFIDMVDRIRSSAAPDDADCVGEILQAYDAGLMLVSLTDQNEPTFNAFYRATLRGRASWLSSHSVEKTEYFGAMEAYWNELLEMMREDLRWREESR